MVKKIKGNYVNTKSFIAKFIKTIVLIFFGLFTAFCLFDVIDSLGYYRSSQLIVGIIAIWLVFTILMVFLYAVGEIVELLDVISKK